MIDNFELTIEKIRIILESMVSEEDLRPYKNLGNGLYELPGNIICNKKGLNEYLNKDEIQNKNSRISLV